MLDYIHDQPKRYHVLFLPTFLKQACAVSILCVSVYPPHQSLKASMKLDMYRVFKAQADWTFILPSELPTKELRHLPRKMPR
jgi:hypothetical protein